MSSSALIQKFRSEIELTPVSGSSSLHTIQPVQLGEAEDATAMTEDDWDKFEADIYEAFEQLP